MTSWNSSAGTVAPRRAQSDSEFFKRPAAPKVTTRPREVFRSLRDQPDYASRHLSATSDLSRGSSGSGSALPKKKSSASAAPGGHSVRSVLANIHHEQEKDLRLAMERQRAERSQLATQLTGVTTKQRGPAFNSTSKMSTGKPYVATGMTLKSPSSSGTGSGVGVRKSRPVTGRPDVMRGREAAAATLLAAARSGGGARPSTAGNISSGLSQMEQDDLQQYGGDERVPTGYVRKKLLGKGGCAAVWLASGPIGDLVALKQVAKAHGQMGGSAENSARAEIEAAALLAEVSRMPGHSNIISLHACEETRRDIFCVFEIGGKCLTKHLFEMKGEFSNGARIYRIVHQPFYLKMKSSIGLTHLRDFLRQMFSALEVLRTVNIVHADIKPENILVRQHENGAFCAQLCDFGSSTVFQEGRVGVATPEYMPPEILKKNSLRSMRQVHFYVSKFKLLIFAITNFDGRARF